MRTLPAIGAAALVVLLVSAASTVTGSNLTPSLPGQIPKSPPFLANFPIAFAAAADYRPREGSVTVADLDRDGKPDLIVSLPTGVLTVLRSDGSTFSGWPRVFESLPQPAYPLGAPGIGDLDGDGSPDVVTCVVSGDPVSWNLLYAFRADGSLISGWPVDMHTSSAGYFSCSPGGVLLADLDGDRRPEVVRGMSLDEVQAFRGDGTSLPGWPVHLGPDALGHLRGINADLVAADLDHDGRQEVLLVESGFEPRFAAILGDGSFMNGFPLVLPEVVARQAPAAADLDGDGFPELVQSTVPFSGTSPDGGSPGGPTVPAALHVMRADGKPFPGWPRPLTAGGPWGSVLADLLAQGHPAILQEDGDQVRGYDASGAALPGFPLTVHHDFLRSDSTLESSWVVADLDGDGRPDLVQAESALYAGATYLRLFGLHTNGQKVQGFPFDTSGFLAVSKPVAVDLNADGVNDLVVLATDGLGGGYRLLAWDLGALLQGNRN